MSDNHPRIKNTERACAYSRERVASSGPCTNKSKMLRSDGLTLSQTLAMLYAGFVYGQVRLTRGFDNDRGNSGHGWAHHICEGAERLTLFAAVAVAN